MKRAIDGTYVDQNHNIKSYNPHMNISLLYLVKYSIDPAKVLMNATLFKSPQYQRVYQYLRRHKADQDLDNFKYRNNSVEGKAVDCLEIFLR